MIIFMKKLAAEFVLRVKANKSLEEFLKIGKLFERQDSNPPSNPPSNPNKNIKILYDVYKRIKEEYRE